MSASIPASDTNNVTPQHEKPNRPDESEVTTAQDGSHGRKEAAGVTEGDANLLLNLSNVPPKGSPIVLRRNDILSGRGRGPNSHSGNVYYRSLIKSEKLAYVNGNPREKKMIITKILSKIELMNPPGRFLKENSQNNDWELVSPDEARKKTAQALRENAVKIRRSLTPGEMDHAAASLLPLLTAENRAKRQGQNNNQHIPPPVPSIDPMNHMKNWDRGGGFPNLHQIRSVTDHPNSVSYPVTIARETASTSRGGGFPKLRQVTSVANQPTSIPCPRTVSTDNVSIKRDPEPVERKRRDPPGNHCDEIDVNWQKRRTEYHP